MERSIFSNTGKEVELTAPGENIPIISYWGMQGVGSGTSYAAAHVTAVAALLWSENPSKTAEDIRTLMNRSATPKGNPEEYGHGIINYQNASKHPELGENLKETSIEENIYGRQDQNGRREESPANGDQEMPDEKILESREQNTLTPTYEIPASLKASWGKPDHAELIPAVNGMTAHEISVVRGAVKEADNKKILGKYDILHARESTNYVSAAKIFFQASKSWNGNINTLNSLASAYNSSDELGTNIKANTQRDLKTVMKTAATVNLENGSSSVTNNRGKLQLLAMALHVAGDAYSHKCMCDGSDKGEKRNTKNI